MRDLFTHLVFWHWLAFALILGILDVVLGVNFLFVWCGLAAALVGVLLLLIPKLSWEFQFLIFGIGVLASLFGWRQLNKKGDYKTDQPQLNRRARQYIGRTFTLDVPIVNGRGKVRVDDSQWMVEGVDMEIGTTVKVVDVDGVILKVEKT
jgi:membrane protein implicated in regulation of membrane protease activity